MSDKTLMRLKDGILIIGTIMGLLVGLGKFYNKPYELELTVQNGKDRLDRIEPLVQEHTTQLAVIRSQYTTIERQLIEINRKLNR